MGGFSKVLRHDSVAILRERRKNEPITSKYACTCTLYVVTCTQSTCYVYVYVLVLILNVCVHHKDVVYALMHMYMYIDIREHILDD